MCWRLYSARAFTNRIKGNYLFAIAVGTSIQLSRRREIKEELEYGSFSNRVSSIGRPSIFSPDSRIWFLEGNVSLVNGKETFRLGPNMKTAFYSALVKLSNCRLHATDEQVVVDMDRLSSRSHWIISL